MKKAVLSALVILLVVTISACGFWLARYIIDSAAQAQAYEDLSQRTTISTPRSKIPDSSPPPEPSTESAQQPQAGEPGLETRHDVKALKSENRDCAGWITVPGTEIDYPIMWTPDKPEKYLYLNFSGEESSHGAPFLDARCTPESANLLLYGHNMFDGSMFTDVLNFSDRDYLREHNTIHLELEGKALVFEAVASVRTRSDSRILGYTEPVNDAVFLADIQKECPYRIGITPGTGNRYITLVTCDISKADGRALLIGKLKGESTY